MKGNSRQIIELGALLLVAVGLWWLVGTQPSSNDDVRARLKPEESQPSSPEQKQEKPFQGSLTRLVEAKVSAGYTLYPVVGTAEVLLLDVAGKIVHRWELDAQRARLLPNGNLLVVHGSKWGARVEPWKTLKFRVREYSWQGELVWEYESPGRAHHDVARLENGNSLFPYRTTLSPEKHSTIALKRRRRMPEIRSDVIVEVTPQGDTVWSWNAEEHLDVNSCGKPKCGDENIADWTHINTTSIIPPNKWFDAGDTRFRPGNILTLLRNWWTAKIIDRESKEVVWSYQGDYKGGLSGGHDAVMIEKGLPGEGNILIFDNGRILHPGESYALEINPQSKELVWVYDVGKEFFSNSAGSLQRLPNGNTLLSEDLAGRVIEVTPNKEIVWEYKGNYRIARAHRYSPTFTEKFGELS